MPLPLLSSLPATRRAILFAPIALGAFFVAFLILALSTHNPFFTFLLSIPAGIASAWALVGWPHVTRKDGSPLVPAAYRAYKAWLFFPLAPLLMVVLYPILGVLLTDVRLPVTYVAWTSIALSAIGGVAIAYFLVGFPDLVREARRLAALFPPDRRPFLFFPAFVLTFLLLYLVFGVLSTQLLGRVANTALALNVQVLVLLPLTLLLAGGIAYLLFGFPPIKHSPREALEKVPGRRRPLAFGLTFLLLGIPLTFMLGTLVSGIALLPDEVLLPLGVLLGFSVSLGIAALTWGTPQKWRTFADYKPGLPPHTRVPLLVLAVVATIATTAIIFGLFGLDIFWGLLTGLAAGTLLGLQLSGATKKIIARKGEASLVPELPDGVKPLILFPSWFLLAGLVFATLTYAWPDLVPLNFLVAVSFGLMVSVGLIEQSTFQDMLAERRREKEKRRAWEQRRREALAGKVLDDDAPGKA